MSRLSVFGIFGVIFVSTASVCSAAQLTSIELGASETQLNKCLVEHLKRAVPPIQEEVVVERGFAFRGTFPTHPLFNDVPVLFVSYLVPVTGSPNEVRVTRDVHIAVPSLHRTGWQLRPQMDGQGGEHVAGVVDGRIFFSVVDSSSQVFEQVRVVSADECFR